MKLSTRLYITKLNIKHHDAVYETVHHPEEGHMDYRNVCHNCGADITGHAVEHIQQNGQNGCCHTEQRKYGL